MAYNRKNFLLGVIDVLNVYRKWQAIGLKNNKIWEDHIYPQFKISKRTFDEYLGIPAEKELKELLQKESEADKRQDKFPWADENQVEANVQD